MAGIQKKQFSSATDVRPFKADKGELRMIDLDGPAAGIGEYVTWSGAELCCLGSPAHRPTATLGPYGIPTLPALTTRVVPVRRSYCMCV